MVAVCIGLYSNKPHLPDFQGRDQLAGKRVCVVGYGKSAAVAAETHIVVPEPHWPFPRRLAGIVPFKWGLLSRMVSTLIPPYQRISGVERIVH